MIVKMTEIRKTIDSIKQFLVECADSFSGEIQYTRFFPGMQQYTIPNIHKADIPVELLQSLQNRQVDTKKITLVEVCWTDKEDKKADLHVKVKSKP